MAEVAAFEEQHHVVKAVSVEAFHFISGHAHSNNIGCDICEVQIEFRTLKPTSVSGYKTLHRVIEGRPLSCRL